MTTRLDILGLGVSTIDELVVLEHHPRLNVKQKILSRSRQCGGLTGSALVAASRMGCRCGHLLALGTGDLSAFLRKTMAAEGVELFEDGDDPETEPYYAMILSEASSGERSVLWDNSRARAPKIGDRERQLALSAKCLFVDHIYASEILPIVREARAAGVDVVGDFERTTPDSLALMEVANHIILPLAYARTAAGLYAAGEAPGIPEKTMPGKPAAEMSAAELATYFARTPGRAVACVTDGVNGAWWAGGDAPERTRHQPIFAMESIADTTGCGDVFHGVYSAGLSRKLPVGERIRQASAAAALKTQRRGAQAGAPKKAELQQFLQERE